MTLQLTIHKENTNISSADTINSRECSLSIVREGIVAKTEEIVSTETIDLYFGHIFKGESAYQGAVAAGYPLSKEKFYEDLANISNKIGASKISDGAIEERHLSSDVKNIINNKVEKVAGKGLSTNDFTNLFKTTLEELPYNYALKNEIPTELEKFKDAKYYMRGYGMTLTPFSQNLNLGVYRYGTGVAALDGAPNGATNYGNLVVFRGENNDTLVQIYFNYTNDNKIFVRSSDLGKITTNNKEWQTIAYISNIPTDNNQLTNGAGYTTLDDVGKKFLGINAQAADSAKLGGLVASSYATKDDIANIPISGDFVSKTTYNEFRALFDSLFEYDAANNAIHARKSLYSYGNITAGGIGSSGGSVGGGGISEINAAMIIDALGYTPYNGSANPNGYISLTTANSNFLGKTDTAADSKKLNGIDASEYALKTELPNTANFVSITTYNEFRTLFDSLFEYDAAYGAIHAKKSLYSDGAITAGGIGSSGGSGSGSGGGISEITKPMIVSALGYEPYSASNPNGYITQASLSGYAQETWVNTLLAGGNYMRGYTQKSPDFINDRTIGVYRYGAGVSSAVGAPTGAKDYGNLVVFRGGTNDTLVQLYFNYSDDNIFVRSNTSALIQSNGASWKTLAYKTDIPTKLSDLIDDQLSGYYLPITGGEIKGNVEISTGYKLTTRKIVVTSGQFAANIEIDGSSLSIDRELMLTRGGTADISPGIAAAFKTKVAQTSDFITNNILMGTSAGSASNLPLNFCKYTSISSYTPSGLQTLMSLEPNGILSVSESIKTKTVVIQDANGNSITLSYDAGALKINGSAYATGSLTAGV